MIKTGKALSTILIQDNDFANLDKILENIKTTRCINEVFVLSNKKIDPEFFQYKYNSINISFYFEYESVIEIINKSVSNLNNEYFIILNSNEFFCNDNINFILEKYLYDGKYSLLFANSILKDFQNKFLGFSDTPVTNRLIENIIYLSEITTGSFIFSKSLFKKLGGLNKKLNYYYLLEFISRAINDNSYIFSSEVIICKYFDKGKDNKFNKLQKNLEILEIVLREDNIFKIDLLEKRILSSINLLKDNEIDSIIDKNNYSDVVITKLNILRKKLKISQNYFYDSQFIKSIPNDLKIILESRLDLQKQGFNLSENERKFCQWLIKYGFKEYPPLRNKNCESSTLYWLKQNRNGENISRMYLAIFDSNKLFRKLYKIVKFEILRKQFVSFIWAYLPYNLPSQNFYYGNKNYLLLLRKAIKKFTVIRQKKLKNNLNYHKEGVNLIGYAKHALGIGEDLRSTFFALDECEINTSIINFPPGAFKGREENTLKKIIKNIHPYNTTIICLTAEESLRYFMKVGTLEFDNKYVIGYWPWELPIWPKNWESAIDYVNEIWVSSKHIKNSLKGITNKPVKLMPLCIDQPNFKIKQQSLNERINNRKRFNLDKKSIYLCFSFDQNSYIERKNPWAALRAFQMAFPPIPKGNINNQLKLLIKTFPSNKSSYEWEKLKRTAELDPRIKIIEKNMTRYDLLNLYGCCDIFLSLHRAEGYGRCLAEALQLGLDLIATNWSGNTDFCKGPLYHPIPFKLKSVQPFDYPYWQNQFWAEPDLTIATDILKDVVKKRIEKGIPDEDISKSYQNYFSARNCGARYRERLEELNLISVNSKIF